MTSQRPGRKFLMRLIAPAEGLTNRTSPTTRGQISRRLRKARARKRRGRPLVWRLLSRRRRIFVSPNTRCSRRRRKEKRYGRSRHGVQEGGAQQGLEFWWRHSSLLLAPPLGGKRPIVGLAMPGHGHTATLRLRPPP